MEKRICPLQGLGVVVVAGVVGSEKAPQRVDGMSFAE